MSWEEVKDEEGRLYYYNSETQQTQWEKPDELESEIVKVIRENTNWSLFTTDEGKFYYYNNDSGESVWKCPDIVKDLLISKGLEIPREEEEEDDEDKDNNNNIDNDDNMSEDQLIENEDDKMDEDQPEELSRQSKTAVTPGNNLIKLSDLIESNKSNFEKEKLYLNIDYSKLDPQESKEKFMQMLSEKVDGNWPFNKVMETFINDIRYWQIQDSLIRKNLYDLYLIQLADKEFEKVENSREKYKSSFFKMLSNYPQIKYYTRWKTCQSLIIDESLYSLVPGKLKREFFDEYVNNLRNENDLKFKETKKNALQELEDFLRTSLKLDITVSWNEIIKILKNDQRFLNNKNMTSLNDLDILTVYESIMNELEINFDKEVKSERKKTFRSDRKARDKFKELLTTIKSSNPDLMNAKTKWFEFVQLLKNDERFIELCGRRGSSPIDFYWDFIDQENQILKAKKDMVSQVLINYNENNNNNNNNNNEIKFSIPQDYQFTNDENDELFKIFVKILEDSKGLKDCSKTDLRLIFELIVLESNKKSPEPSSDSNTTTSVAGIKRKIDDVSPSPEPNSKKLTTLGYGVVKK